MQAGAAKRRGLLECWHGDTTTIGHAVPELLHANCDQPWVHCDTRSERLDLFKGLLLAPHLVAVFDAGLISAGPANRHITVATPPPAFPGGRIWCHMAMSATLTMNHAVAAVWHRCP